MNRVAFQTFARRPLLALGLLLASAGALAAQGIVSGRVTDQANGNPLVGARVIVVGTSLTASTNADGRYRIPGVPAGPDRKSTRLNSSHVSESRMPSSA